MSVAARDLTMMVEPSGRVWIDSQSFVDYLRMVEARSRKEATARHGDNDIVSYAALMAVQDTIRQIADSLTVTAMEANAKMGRSGDVAR